MLARQSARQRQSMSDRADRKRAGLDDPKSGVGQRRNALGMHVAVEQADEGAVNLAIRERLLPYHHQVLRIVVAARRFAVPRLRTTVSWAWQIRIEIGPSGFFSHNFKPPQILLLLCPK
jgi:hypothetical protein